MANFHTGKHRVWSPKHRLVSGDKGGDKGTVLLSPFLDNTKMIVYYPIG